MSISSGWREQYERMQRSHTALVKRATGQINASSDEARDTLYHFFQDAYHLRDWLRNDEAGTDSHKSAASRFGRREVLRTCADLCNGTKHYKLRTAWTRDVSTAFASQSVSVRPAAAGSGQPPRPAVHSWTIESRGSQYDALTVADDVIAAWDTLLREAGILT
jgi:hypothetical protein